MLGGNVNLIIWDQFKKSFYTKFFYVNLRDAKRQEFLAVNHANIEYSRKEVVFNLHIETNFKYKEAGITVLCKVVSAIKASKLLNHGAWNILTSVVDTREAEVCFTSESVVRDYPNIFPKKLPRLPPHREIDFTIKLELCIVPISRALYKMAPDKVERVESAVVGIS
ncbi:ty3-gypsy retrotransposon protein [Cucumis melo var. makuwa]|uniref:Ty3-gypsy retrotransposon protein n=1 Tax=Cucumis melo var. makuwa TaxID=1194695 RepID=A0A5A7TX69_CUCMM|nr:ty3-gypsy retrotransposon protein [Cucumis melo var. makuwa]TYK28752.1 ty3-gypsy retrotransposon protein [Cucumis melo var. makuwa]